MNKMLIAAALVLAAGTADAQTPAHDPTEKLNAVLPAEVAARVTERIAQARARQLPAQALEHRALELAAKGASASEIEQKVDGYAKAMELAAQALSRGRGSRPSGEEVAAGGDVLLRGVDGQKVAELASSAPSGRSMAVPLYVLGALMERGLPSDAALEKVTASLAARESDAQMQAHVDALPAPAADRRNATTGPAAGAANRPAFAGPPAGVPVNPGAPGQPSTTPPVQNPPVQTPPTSGPPPAE